MTSVPSSLFAAAFFLPYFLLHVLRMNHSRIALNAAPATLPTATPTNAWVFSPALAGEGVLVGVAGITTPVAVVVAFWVVWIVVAVPTWTVTETMLTLAPLSEVTGGATLSVDDVIAAVELGADDELVPMAQDANIVEAQDEVSKSTLMTYWRLAVVV